MWNIRRAITIKKHYLGVIARDDKKNKSLKSVPTKHIIIFSDYKLIEEIVTASYKVAKLTTKKKIPFRVFFSIYVYGSKRFLFISSTTKKSRV